METNNNEWQRDTLERLVATLAQIIGAFGGAELLDQAGAPSNRPVVVALVAVLVILKAGIARRRTGTASMVPLTAEHIAARHLDLAAKVFRDRLGDADYDGDDAGYVPTVHYGKPIHMPAYEPTGDSYYDDKARGAAGVVTNAEGLPVAQITVNGNHRPC
jgi:hypothetical protein